MRAMRGLAPLLCVVAVIGLTSGQEIEMTPKGGGIVTAKESGIRLKCFYNVSDAETGELVEVKWFRVTADDVRVPVETMEEGDEEDKEKNGGHTITVEKDGTSVLKLGRDFHPGAYLCNGDGETGSFTVKQFFKLEKWERSTVVFQGDDLKLPCKLKERAIRAGNPVFRWYRKDESLENPKENDQRSEIIYNKTDLSDEGEPHFKIWATTDDKTGQPGSTFKIEDALYEDRGIYQCEVTNDDGSVYSVQSMVRVKDKYGAFYPFIGIVIEVVVLCFVIFVCEKRRASKEAADAADDEEEFNGGAVGASGNNSSNVRHRRN